jgi:hypothetical protein
MAERLSETQETLRLRKASFWKLSRKKEMVRKLFQAGTEEVVREGIVIMPIYVNPRV